MNKVSGPLNDSGFKLSHIGTLKRLEPALKRCRKSLENDKNRSKQFEAGFLLLLQAAFDPRPCQERGEEGLKRYAKYYSE